MTESEKIPIQLLIEANLLISALTDIFKMKITKRDLIEALYLAYGLNKREAKTLIETSKGKLLPNSTKVVNKALEELAKFLIVCNYKEYVKLFFIIGIVSNEQGY